MKKIVINILKTLGLYTPLLNYKRRLDHKNFEKQEQKLHLKRIDFYKGFVTKDDLVFDIGANIGNRTQVFLLMGAKVVAIEPQLSCISVLKQKFAEKIQIEQVGIGSRQGEMEMFIADESTISTFSEEFIEKTKDKFKRNTWNEKIKVKILTLDDLIMKYGIPKFCKIDVEGYEVEVIKGLTHPIPIISFEYNVPHLINNVNSCLQLLNKISPEYLFNYSIGESMSLELPQWKSFNEFREIIGSSKFNSSDFGDIYATISK